MDQGKQSISLEPGGQFELSGAPLETLHQTCAEVNSHLYQVCAFCMLVLYGVLGCRHFLFILDACQPIIFQKFQVFMYQLLLDAEGFTC